MIEIKHKQTGAVLLRIEGNSLRGADLARADLREASLEAMDLEGADLHEADLCCACLASANLSYANLEGARLRGADLGRANLYGARLDGADVAGANLAQTLLAEAKLQGVRYDDHTRWAITDGLVCDRNKRTVRAVAALLMARVASFALLLFGLGMVVQGMCQRVASGTLATPCMIGGLAFMVIGAASFGAHRWLRREA